MAVRLTWDEILKRDDIVGGDIEIQVEGNVFRGPIKSIYREGKMVVIENRWTAKMMGDGRWARKRGYDVCKVNALEVGPTDFGQGRIAFQAPPMGMFIIFPKDGSKLDPSKVEGLDIH